MYPDLARVKPMLMGRGKDALTFLGGDATAAKAANAKRASVVDASCSSSSSVEGGDGRDTAAAAAAERAARERKRNQDGQLARLGIATNPAAAARRQRMLEREIELELGGSGGGGGGGGGGSGGGGGGGGGKGANVRRRMSVLDALDMAADDLETEAVQLAREVQEAGVCNYFSGNYFLVTTCPSFSGRFFHAKGILSATVHIVVVRIQQNYSRRAQYVRCAVLWVCLLWFWFSLKNGSGACTR
jgi:hypothetical protein